MADSKRARRAARMRRRVAAAQTSEEQVAAAFDWFRCAARHVRDAGERSRVMREMATALARGAQAIEGSDRT
jgi:hypothetical protein